MTSRDSDRKVLSTIDLSERLRAPRSEVIVFTNGVFDLIHRGHVEYLSAARSMGDVLVVGVNSDASVRRLEKGRGRPLVGQADRAIVLAALHCVDYVCFFDEATPTKLIGQLIPDVLVKGSDYDITQIAGREIVQENGGRVEVIPFLKGYSTTGLVRRIREYQDYPPPNDSS